MSTANMNTGQVRVVDPVLSTVAHGYVSPDFVGGILFPFVDVDISGGKVLTFGKEAFQQYSLRRAPGADTPRVSFGYQGAPYSLVQDAIEVPVPREHQRDASVMPGIDLGTRAVNFGMRIVMQALEVDRAAIALNAANYDNDHKVALTSGDKWSAETGTPSADIDTAKEAVRASTGMIANTVLLSAVAFNAARNNANVLERFKYTSSDSVTADMLAKLWDVERVVVGRAISADDAGAFSDIWGNNAVVAYVPASPAGMEQPSYGYTYRMRGHPAVEQAYWDQRSKSWIYGVTMERAPVLTGMAAGYLIQNPN
ncbi:major capsid protein [Oceanibaculum indicum]|uniref:Uncharacterized protein n=1 Tax=Oceanibaculum indicum P24 TaxID=1207063 RepID=K2KLV3_9PROT|nr:major capsid protein [Oceanibaculum indicum]EKE78435.1 hypothetical protein P24_02706 [Oceanibaculum indicum P24]